jgi:hypothetical protein
MKFVYAGWSQAQVDLAMARYRASINPPEKPGVPAFYHIVKSDGYAEGKIKEERTLAWKDKRCAEYLEGLQPLMEQISMQGTLFKKGVPVEVSPSTELGQKLTAMCKGHRPSMFSIVEEKQSKKSEDK